MFPGLASVLLSGLIGLTLGMFGGGGSLLTVPVLVFVTQLTPAAAVGTSLAMVGTTSLVASYAHHRQGLVKPKVALVFGLSGVATAFGGAKVSALVPEFVIMYAFAALTLLAGIGMLFREERRAAPPRQTLRGDPSLLRSMLSGAGVGLVTGFLGVGGGFLVVPALIASAGLDVREAVGTSLLVVAINSAAGFVGHWVGGQLDVVLIAVLTAAALAGALVGERLARRSSTLQLARGFGVIVVAVGVTVVLASKFVPAHDWH